MFSHYKRAAGDFRPTTNAISFLRKGPSKTKTEHKLLPKHVFFFYEEFPHPLIIITYSHVHVRSIIILILKTKMAS